MSEDFDQLNAALAGRYAIQRLLGRGGMARVFLASDLRHRQRAVAIKVLDPELAAAIGPERFLREIEIAASLNHPHILPVHDSGSANGLLYYVMPYAEGGSLRQRLEREKQLPLADALRIAREVADALDSAHRRGVVHRDIKPENILLSEQHAVVADFGIARAVAAAGDTRGLTGTGVVIGTPACMSPEQAAGSKEVDGRSDQYSLGCVLYEMLAGQPPFTGPTGDSIIHQQRNVAPRPVTDLRPTVPDGVARALERTLAKTPADRFGTTTEFAAAIAAGPEPATGPRPDGDESRTKVIERGSSEPVPEPPSHRVRAVALAGAVLVMAYVAVAAWQHWWPFQPGPPAKKDLILVAEFDGPAADSAIVAATRDLVMAALDQSEIVATVPRDQIGLALKSAGKPATTRVDAEVARELAYRSAVKAVLEGRVGRLGKGYSIVLSVVDADNTQVLVSVSDAAADEESLIPTVGRIAKSLRKDLGERRSAVQATRELNLTNTPSLEAYKTFEKGRVLSLGGDQRAAITLLRSALALDPDYASAWMMLGYAFGNLGEADSALVAFREAEARPERLGPRWALGLASAIAFTSGDMPGTLAASEREVRLAPQSVYVHFNRSNYLSSAGRLSEALESARTAERVSPFGASPGLLWNQFVCLIKLGRVDDARTLAPRLPGGMAVQAPMDIAAAAGQWSAAESLAKVLDSSPSLDDFFRPQARAALAAVRASRGQVSGADRTFRQAQSLAEAKGDLLSANFLRWSRLPLMVYSHGVAAAPGEPGRWDSTTAGLVTRGLWAAAAGDTTLARRLLATIRTRPATQVARLGFAPELLQAWIAARGGRWQEVLNHIGPAALQGEAVGSVNLQSAPLMRWMAAEAYDRLGPPDSAAVYFERAIAPPPEGGANLYEPRMAFSFAHRRLVLLYARTGRLEEARRHWEIFSATFTQPDPEMAPLVEEARTALASAEAMARATRR